MGGMLVLAVVGGIVLLVIILAVVAIGIYNKLVSMGVGYKNSYAQIDVQLKRRYDLIPNLVETAKGYLAHEKGTLEAVIKARNAAASAATTAAANPGDPAAMGALASAEGALGQTLGRLFALSEAYPDLKANVNMMQLSEELTSTENRISFARQAYNDAAARFNAYRRSFPPVLFAGLFGYGSDAAMLTFEEGKALQQAPSVKF